MAAQIEENTLIPQQTQAEKDKALFQCFHDAGFIQKLIQDDNSIIAGRTGAGKTAIARYVEEQYEQYGLAGALRLSITSFTRERLDTSNEVVLEKILLFVLLKTAKYFLDNDFLKSGSKEYWERVFKDSGVQNVTDYKTFATTKRENRIGFLGVLNGQLQETREEQTTQITSDNLFSSLLDSFEYESKTPQILILLMI